MAITVTVYHAGYNCETGCCGHIVELSMPDGAERSQFEFDHPHGKEVTAWARELAEETVRRHWPQCMDSIDWASLNVEGVDDNC